MRLITKPELLELIEDTNPFVLDVREAEEYEQGHIPQSILAPWHSITKRVEGMKPQTPIILYCRANGRAKKAATLLENNGFTDVSVYEGGWQEWDN